MNDMAEYREMFVAEAQENLQALSDGALKLERQEEAPEAVDVLFRAAHTLKGMSATMGFEGLTRVCHAMEDVLDAVRSGGCKATPELADALLASVDSMTLMLGDVAGGGDGGPPDAGLLERFRALERGESAAPAAPSEEPAGPDLLPGQESLLPEDQDSRRDVVEAFADSPTVVRLTVSLEASCAFRGVRALLVRKALERLGSVVATRPKGRAFEEGVFERNFDLWTVGPYSAEEQEQAVLRVLEVEAVSSVTLDAGALPGGGPARPAMDLSEPVAAELVQPPVEEIREAEPGAEQLSPAPESGSEQPAGAAASAPVAAASLHQTVRVNVERLDKVLDLVGELVTARIRLSQIARDSGLKDLGDALIQVDHIVKDLQQEVTAARMVPMDQIFSRFPRLIRDLSRDLNKPMDLALEGRDIELDRSILDEIGDALVHLLRNAADHGIEPTEQRSAAGKPAVGTIRLEARRDKNHVMITVEDDGAGIDTDRVRQVAVERGLLSAEAARLLPEDEAVSLIFAPGFSTARRVTELSGRGVGVDAVRARAEALGGSLRVENFPGRGTRFRIRVPLTLAIIRALRVRVGQEHYMAPVANVVEAVEYSRNDIGGADGAPTVRLREEYLPLLRLDKLLDLKRAAPDPGMFTVLVVDAGERRVALVVDEALGQQEIAIKSLGRGLKAVRGFAGVTILGDGSVCLILDLPSLLDL
jgi:two-component system, chemotaxis family, sensor kinase CheA